MEKQSCSENGSTSALLPHFSRVYSDGSLYRKRETSAQAGGLTIRKGGTTEEVYRNRGRLHRAEVFDAEVHGALQGLAAARTIGPNKRLFVCLDNISVVDGLNGSPPESSQSTFMQFQKLAAAHGPGVVIKWFPGHQDIEGNEAADKHAKEGAMLETRIDSLPTVAWVRRHLKGKRKDEFARW